MTLVLGWVCFWLIHAWIWLIYARRSLLRLIYARPCNWLVIPWPQLGYSSISILCHTLLYLYLLYLLCCPIISIVSAFFSHCNSMPCELCLPGKTYNALTKNLFHWGRHLFVIWSISKLPWYMQLQFLFSSFVFYKCVWESHVIHKQMWFPHEWKLYKYVWELSFHRKKSNVSVIFSLYGRTNLVWKHDCWLFNSFVSLPFSVCIHSIQTFWRKVGLFWLSGICSTSLVHVGPEKGCLWLCICDGGTRSLECPF